MPTNLFESVCDVWEDTSPFLMSRFLLNDGTAGAQGDITSISYTVYDRFNETVVGSGSLTVSDVIFNTLQTDSRWEADGTGYNFGWALPASLLPEGDLIYEVDVNFNPVAGEDFPGGRWLLSSQKRHEA